MSAKVQGLERLRETVLQRFPAEAQKQMAKANQKNATEFYSLVRRIIPVGDPERGHLRDTLRFWSRGTGHGVTIGGPTAPYPLKLEFGHRNRDGSMTPGVPFWYPAMRVSKKKMVARSRRTLNAVVKATAAGATKGAA